MQTINTKSAPDAIGPYSQGIISGGFLFTSGQIPLSPKDGTFTGGTIEVQTERILKNLDAVLDEACVSWDKVVKTTVFLTDLADFGKMNEIYGKHLGEARPARSTVQVAALPRGAKVEIELVAEV
jgi:2-iminobutanoate/2-iminopropanoate deaminase